ncbi:hypothetical protein NPIL_476021 [Nephila pilipes]|uniref:DUF4817 domain-containing protein n=1 Tax=Nephila pilipes TaxID=299642 RepID=A0A8X6N738_NEPPI|nr:hypothetical protein NPIL_476021 [Nephila pilipes]
MLNGKDKVLLVKPFYMNEKSATVALCKFRLQKNVKTLKGPLILASLTKLVQRFEETGSYEVWKTKSKSHTFGASCSRNGNKRQNPLQGLSVQGKLADA